MLTLPPFKLDAPCTLKKPVPVTALLKATLGAVKVVSAPRVTVPL